MPAKFDFLSPGIDIQEIDQSSLPPAADEEGPIIIGRTRKGPAEARCTFGLGKYTVQSCCTYIY